nr:MAG TPA: hypothetical protein [Caudoviricetes sp.]
MPCSFWGVSAADRKRRAFTCRMHLRCNFS